MYFRTIKARLFEDTLKGFIDGFGWYTIWNNKNCLQTQFKNVINNI